MSRHPSIVTIEVTITVQILEQGCDQGSHRGGRGRKNSLQGSVRFGSAFFAKRPFITLAPILGHYLSLLFLTSILLQCLAQLDSTERGCFISMIWRAPSDRIADGLLRHYSVLVAQLRSVYAVYSLHSATSRLGSAVNERVLSKFESLSVRRIDLWKWRRWWCVR